SGSFDRTLKVWDASTRENTLTLRGHEAYVYSVAFSPDGTRIVSGSEDKTLRIWETKSPPLGVPAARRAVESARGVVTSLYGELVWPDAVMVRLRTDESLTEPVRRAALRMAKNYPLGGYAWELNAESWPVVVSPDEAPDRYRAALKQAQVACQLSPNDGNYLNTLGVAQYRVGEYAAALETLTRSDELNSKRTEGTIPADVAFLAMSLHRLGREQEATAALVRLRELMQKKRWATDEESDGFLQEAESLIMGASPSPAKEE
ncbi:MAG: hypothetical protein IID40_06825, partial [Planctomycetes bacterium]|nr:hypothetical protein [Planctomycetota bacterium]